MSMQTVLRGWHISVLLIGIGCGGGALLLSQQAKNESGPGTPQSRKTAEAAISLARAVAPEGTPEYTSALRKALATAQGLPVSEEAARAAMLPVRGLIDLDARYRANFVSIQHDQERIIGGEPVPPGTYPDTVALTGNGRLCTGTVITPNVVLTAAHCFCGGVTERVIVGDSINTPVTTASVTGGTPMIKCTDDLKNGDLAIIRLSTNLAVSPRALAHESLLGAAKSARAVGFGRTANPILEPTGIKRRVDVPIASIACSGTVTTSSGPVADSAFYGCAQGQELVAGAPSLDKDSCNGDSGGPLFVSSQNGALYLAAATSRATGPPGLRPCGDGGIYVRADTRVVKWLASLGIQATIGPAK